MIIDVHAHPIPGRRDSLAAIQEKCRKNGVSRVLVSDCSTYGPIAIEVSFSLPAAMALVDVETGEEFKPDGRGSYRVTLTQPPNCHPARPATKARGQPGRTGTGESGWQVRGSADSRERPM